MRLPEHSATEGEIRKGLPFYFVMKVYILFESYDYEGNSDPLCATTDKEVADQWRNQESRRLIQFECGELGVNDFSGIVDNRSKFGKWLKEHLNDPSMFKAVQE